MKNFFRIGTAFFMLAFTAIFFAACGGNNWGGVVSYVDLTGSEDGYRIAEHSTGESNFFSNGYIHNNGLFGINISKNEENAAAEFRIIGSSLRIEIYEGQTLPSGNHIYVYSGYKGNGTLIGRIYITKTNDELEFSYEEYDYYPYW